MMPISGLLAGNFEWELFSKGTHKAMTSVFAVSLCDLSGGWLVYYILWEAAGGGGESTVCTLNTGLQNCVPLLVNLM